MDLEQKAEELLERINLMKRCYYKGLKNKTAGLFADVHCYISYPEGREELKPHLMELLEGLEGLFEAIPYDQIDSNSDFAPVFVMKSLIDMYTELARRMVERVDEPADLCGEALKRMMARLEGIDVAIHEVGELYRRNIIQELEELKKMPGYEDFEFIITDKRGRKYSSRHIFYPRRSEIQ